MLRGDKHLSEKIDTGDKHLSEKIDTLSEKIDTGDKHLSEKIDTSIQIESRILDLEKKNQKPAHKRSRPPKFGKRNTK